MFLLVARKRFIWHRKLYIFLIIFAREQEKKTGGGAYIDCNFLAESCVVSDLSVIPDKDDQLFVLENNKLVLLENDNSEIVVKENGVVKVVFVPL